MIAPAVADRDEEDAREADALRAAIKKGGRFWSSTDSWQSSLPKTSLATTEGVILIRPVQDAVIKIVNTGKTTRNPNLPVAVTAFRVPGKEVPAKAGKLLLGTRVELHWTGKVVARSSETALNPMLREQRAVLNWWPETDEDLPQKADAFLYLTYPNQPTRAVSNILQLQVEFVD
jgi:hypothetical protein